MRVLSGSSYLSQRGLIFLALSAPFLILGCLTISSSSLGDTKSLFGFGVLGVGGWLLSSAIHYFRGSYGESGVVHSLASRLDARYTLFQNVKLPNSKADLDAVLLGPSNIFVLEIKNYNPRNSYRCEGDTWYYRRPGKRYRRLPKSPTKQAQYNAGYLKTFLSKQAIKGIPIEPAIVIANDEVKVYWENPYVPIYEKAEFVSHVKDSEQGPVVDSNIINIINEAVKALEGIR